MSTQKRMSRKELHQPDRVQLWLYGMVNYIVQHQQWFILGALLIVVCFFSIWGGVEYYKAEQIKLSDLFYSTQKVLYNPQLSPLDRQTQGLQALQEFQSKEPDAFLSVLGLMQMAEIYIAQSRWNQAEQTLQQVLAHPATPHFMQHSAKTSLASLYMQQQKWQEAQQLVATIEDPTWEDLRWKMLAQIALGQGDAVTAKTHLEKLINSAADSIFKQEARIMLMTLN